MKHKVDTLHLYYHGFDAFGEEEAVVERVHSVIGFHSTLPLQQDWPSVQPIISPEHTESSFLITMDKSPATNRLK